MLGPVELVVDGRIMPVPGASERALLALLGLTPGRTVSTDRLIDALWGEGFRPTPSTRRRGRRPPDPRRRRRSLGSGEPGQRLRAPARHLVARPARRPGVVLDTCEHLADPCARFVEKLLTSAGEDLRIIATSRERSACPGELQMPVPPLAAVDAIALFTERVTSVRPDLVFDDSEDDVRRICEQLDGMPLAIELAAARAKALLPSEIAARLNDRFRLLTGGARTALARHQTLRATVVEPRPACRPRAGAVSTPRRLPRRMDAGARRGGVRRGPAANVLDLLSGLVDRSLVEARGGRFRMLETIHAYAAARLADEPNLRGWDGRASTRPPSPTSVSGSPVHSTGTGMSAGRWTVAGS